MPAKGRGKRPRKTLDRCVHGLLSGFAQDITMTFSRLRAIPKGAQVVSTATSPAVAQTYLGVRDRMLDLLPIALQNTLRSEIDLMGENWETPLLPNDAFIIRKSTPEDLPEPEEAAQHAMDLLRGFLSQRTDEYERILDVGFKLPKYTRVSIWMEFFVRSMPVDQRNSYLTWLGERKMMKRRRRE